jgi:protein TonB
MYPDSARAAHIQGDVVLRVKVAANGRVMRMSVVRGIGQLTDAAVEAVKKWVFKPALRNSSPVAAWTKVTVHFPP